MKEKEIREETAGALEEHLREIRAQIRARNKQWLPLESAIRANIDQEFGREIDRNRLWINSGDLDHISFDYFYETDAEQEKSQNDGTEASMIQAILRATGNHVATEPDIRFHSFQFINEKCGGDLYRYLR